MASEEERTHVWNLILAGDTIPVEFRVLPRGSLGESWIPPDKEPHARLYGWHPAQLDKLASAYRCGYGDGMTESAALPPPGTVAVPEAEIAALRELRAELNAIAEEIAFDAGSWMPKGERQDSMTDYAARIRAVAVAIRPVDRDPLPESPS